MIELRNESLSVRILPELGGKISSLFDRRHDREWLWTNPHLARRPPVYGESYVEQLDTGGWDEIFPSISPCVLPGGIDIPDHGDLVFLPADVSDQTPDSLALSILTRSFKSCFSRQFTVDGPKLRIDYTLESLDERPIPYLWAAHPLLALEDGMVLELPTAALTTSEGLDLQETDDGGCRITIGDPALGKQAPHMLKSFTARDQAEWARIQARDGASLRLDWDKLDAPYFGIWLNQRAWSGTGSEPYFNLGFEPTTSPHDDLTSAIAANEHFTLAPHESRSWSLILSLD
ncbi:hypothetical protein [Haloferula sp.]|uniref:hypothetical protein n=1 Tax=Haloferula sp. TaxID=2497595 RepID=UPI003C70A87A